MLRIVACENVKQAKWYYTHGLRYEHLDAKLGRYYAAEQEWIGQWCGQAAARMGLSGKVDQAAFESLCENRHPVTGQRLTLRTKSNRRVGYDFNFHCPKSVSVVHALTGDDRMVDAFRLSVAETMAELEAEAKARVRKKGADEDRLTGNLLWGEFIHFTARPVKGHPDPHLHAHCFVFNSTWDEAEGCWKAAQVGDIVADKAYFQAAFHTRLSSRIRQLG